MRSLSTSLVAVGAAASLAFAVAPVDSADGPDLDTVPYMTEDLAGDANGTRTGLLVSEPVPQTSTAPASVPHADILGARITSVFEEVVGDDGLVDRVLTGLEFRTAMAAEPTASTNPIIHRFMGTVAGCEFWVQAYTGTGGSDPHGTADVRAFEGCGFTLDPDEPLGGSVTVGEGIEYAYDEEFGEMVVTITFADADATLVDNFTEGEFYLLGSLHNRAVVNGVAIVATVPQFDDMPGDNGFTVIGDDVPADEEPAEEEPATEEPTAEGDGQTSEESAA